MAETYIPLRADLLDSTNRLDRLMIDMSEGKGRVMKLTPQGLEKFTKVEKYSELFKKITVKNLFRGLQAYWIIKVLKTTDIKASFQSSEPVCHPREGGDLVCLHALDSCLRRNDKYFPKLDDDMKLWLSHSFLTGAYDGQYVGDLLSAYTYAHKDAKITKLISRNIFFSGGKRPVDEKKLMQRFEALSKKMGPAQLMQLIENASSFSGSKMEGSVLILLDRSSEALKARPGCVDRKKVTASCIEVIIKRKDMFNIVLGGLQNVYGGVEKLKAMMDMEFVWKMVQTKPEELETAFTLPKDITFGMRMATRLAGMGMVDKDIVSKLFKIIKSSDYDVFTRASIVRMLGKIEYADRDARTYAAELLAGFLKDVRSDEWQDTKISRIIFDALIALGKIGIAKTKGYIIPNIIAFYLYDIWQPYLRLAAARGLEIMAKKIDRGSAEFKNIKMGLMDALADKEELVRRVAYNGLVQLER